MKTHRALLRRRLNVEVLEDRRLLATFTVSNLDDAGPGSLRQATIDANALPGADEIAFDAAVIGTISLTGGELTITDSLFMDGQGLITIEATATSRVMNIDDGLSTTVDVSIHGLTITGGFASGESGGGIRSTENLVVTDSAITGNFSYVGGGGVYSDGGTLSVISSTISNNYGATGGGIHASYTRLTISDSTLSHNTAGMSGGGIRAVQSTLEMTTTTIDSNSTRGSGGGIAAYESSVAIAESTVSANSAGNAGGAVNARGDIVTIVDSTIAENTAGINGGGLSASDMSGSTRLQIRNTTISGNSALQFGGGLYLSVPYGGSEIVNSTISGNMSNSGAGIFVLTSSPDDLTLQHVTVTDNTAYLVGGIQSTNDVEIDIENSILAGNQSLGQFGNDAFGFFNSLGVNLVQDVTDANGFTPSDITGVSAMLGPLDDNGGPTQTHAPLLGSPVIDAAIAGASRPLTDQRRFPRVVDGGMQNAPDIGAVEQQQATHGVITGTVVTEGAIGNQLPLPDYQVRLFEDTDGDAMFSPGDLLVQQALTDSNGNYEFESLVSALYFVVVTDVFGGSDDSIAVVISGDGSIVDTIDSFGITPQMIVNPIGPVSESVPAIEAIGGIRSLSLQGDMSSRVDIANGRLDATLEAGAAPGSMSLLWPSSSTVGDSLDLSGVVAPAFRFTYSVFDGVVSPTFRLQSTDGSASELPFDLPLALYREQVIRLADLVPTIGAGVDLSSLAAIEFETETDSVWVASVGAIDILALPSGSANFVFFNTPPVAVDDAYTTVTNSPLSPGLGVNDLLQNDFDPDGQSLTVLTAPVSGPSSGMLVLNGNGTFIYTPNPGFVGTDSFVYEITDGLDLDEATVTITVTPTFEIPDLGSIFGMVAVDANANGIIDSGETITGAVTELFQDTNGTGIFDPLSDMRVATTMTIADGGYTFDMLPADDYFVVQPEQNVDGTPLPQMVSALITVVGVGTPGRRIDTFDTGSLVTDVANDGVPETAVFDAPDAIGSQRDLSASLLADGGFVALASDTGALFANSTQNVFGDFGVTWDGQDGPTGGLDPGGLGGADLTEIGGVSGSGLGFLLSDVVADQPGSNIVLRAYTDANNFSELTLGNLPEDSQTMEAFFAFSRFTSSGGTGADFTNIGAIELLIQAGSLAMNLALTDVGVIGPERFSQDFINAAPQPSINVDVLVNDQITTRPGPSILVGMPVTFKYQVSGVDPTDQFPTELTIINIVDDNGTPNDTSDDFSPTFASGDDDGDGILDDNETWIYMATVTARADQRVHTTCVTALDATDPGTALSNCAQAFYFGITTDGLTIEKQVNGEDADTPPGPSILVGDDIVWTYIVENTGNSPLANVVVTDDQPGVIPTFQLGDDNGNNLLDVGETWVFTAMGIAVAGKNENVGTATADILGQDGNLLGQASANNSANYCGIVGRIALQTLVLGEDANDPPGPFVSDDSVSFTFNVSNLGNGPLSNVVVTTDQAGVLPSFQSGDVNGNDLLDVGEIWTYQAFTDCIPGQNTLLGTVTADVAQLDGTPLGTSITMSDPANYFCGAILSGTVFNDENRNRVQDGNEAGLSGWTVFIDDNGNGMLDPAERSRVTDDAGIYVFSGLLGGDYTLVEVLRDGAAQTEPRSQFDPAVTVAASPLIRSIAGGDVDNDGDRDVIITSDILNTFQVLLNDGHGNFTPEDPIDIGSRPQTVAAGDFDSDGNVDLAITLGGVRSDPATSEVVVLRGNGAGAFTETARIPVAAGPLDLAIGDLDADGDADLAVTSFRSGELTLLDNDGGGNMSIIATIAVGEQPIVAAIGDIDNDGDGDILVGNYLDDNVVSVLNQNGTFVVGMEIGSGLGPGYLELADINGDGNLYLVTAFYGRPNASGEFVANDSVSIALSDGSGGFTQSQFFMLPAGARAEYVTFTDYDFDRDLDLLIVESERSLVSVYKNNGSGSFTLDVELPTTSAPSGGGPEWITVGQFTPDGMPDIVASNFNGDVATIKLSPTPITVAVNDGQTVSGLNFGVIGAAAALSAPFSASYTAGHNHEFAYDTNGDGVVAAWDVLLVVNCLAARTRDDMRGMESVFADVSDDGLITAHDALLIINELQRQQGSKAPLSAGSGFGHGIEFTLEISAAGDGARAPSRLAKDSELPQRVAALDGPATVWRSSAVIAERIYALRQVTQSNTESAFANRQSDRSVAEMIDHIFAIES